MRPGLVVLAPVLLAACGRGMPEDGAPPAVHVAPAAVAPSASTRPAATERDRVALNGETRPVVAAPAAEGPRVYASALRTWIVDKPSPHAERLGYLRAGASSPTGRVAGTDGCPGGWYPVVPSGFVC